jgi:hypothetical protein
MRSCTEVIAALPAASVRAAVSAASATAPLPRRFARRGRSESGEALPVSALSSPRAEKPLHRRHVPRELGCERFETASTAAMRAGCEASGPRLDTVPSSSSSRRSSPAARSSARSPRWRLSSTALRRPSMLRLDSSRRAESASGSDAIERRVSRWRRPAPRSRARALLERRAPLPSRDVRPRAPCGARDRHASAGSSRSARCS